MAQPAKPGGPRRSLCVGLVFGLLVIEGGMVLLRWVWFNECRSPGGVVDPVLLAARLREGATFGLTVHAAVLGGMLVLSVVRPAWAAPRFAAWALFSMAVWMTAYLVQGLDRVAACAQWSLRSISFGSDVEIGLDPSLFELLDHVQGQSIVILGFVFLVAMHVCMCLAIQRPVDDD